MPTYSLHTHTCGELRPQNIGETVTLTGWVWHRRDHGGLIFIDLRDRAGVTQISFDPEHSGGTAFHAAERVRSEWPIKVTGTVRQRPEGQDNEKLATGHIERPPSRLRTTWTRRRTCACATATLTCAVRR